MNEMQPWGLTIAQTVFLCGGGLLLLLGWLFLQLMFKIGKVAFQVGLFLLLGGGACVAVIFIVANR